MGHLHPAALYSWVPRGRWTVTAAPASSIPGPWGGTHPRNFMPRHGGAVTKHPQEKRCSAPRMRKSDQKCVAKTATF